MAAPSGLTRRKGAGGATFAGDSSTASIETDNGRITPSSSRRQENFPTGPETSYEASVDGHKIAYDPRDMAEEAQRNKQPKFSLVEEIVLLGLKDKQVDIWLSQPKEVRILTVDDRVYCLFGTITSHMYYVLQLLWNWLLEDE